MRHHRTARTELMPAAVIYLRVSSDDQTRGVSLSVQDRDCRAWCASACVAVSAAFVEPESAKTDQREQFQRAIAYARAEKVTHFVIWKLEGKRGRLLDAMLAGSVDHDRFASADADLRARIAIAKAEQGAAVLQDSDIEAVMVSAEEILRDLPSASNRLDQADRHALYAILWPRGLTITRAVVRTAVTECDFVQLQTRKETSTELAPLTVDASNLIAFYRRLVEIAA